MAGSPIVLFNAFRVPDDPLRRAWAQFRPELSPRALPPGASVNAPAGIWRLLAKNHRDIGRSAIAYDSFAIARAHVLELQRDPRALNPVVVSDAERGNGWYLETADGAVMTCAHWHATPAIANAAARAAIEMLLIAEVADAPLRTTRSGRRTTRSSGASTGAVPAW